MHDANLQSIRANTEHPDPRGPRSRWPAALSYRRPMDSEAFRAELAAAKEVRKLPQEATIPTPTHSRCVWHRSAAEPRHDARALTRSVWRRVCRCLSGRMTTRRRTRPSTKPGGYWCACMHSRSRIYKRTCGCSWHAVGALTV